MAPEHPGMFRPLRGRPYIATHFSFVYVFSNGDQIPPPPRKMVGVPFYRDRFILSGCLFFGLTMSGFPCFDAASEPKRCQSPGQKLPQLDCNRENAGTQNNLII